MHGLLIVSMQMYETFTAWNIFEKLFPLQIAFFKQNITLIFYRMHDEIAVSIFVYFFWKRDIGSLQ